MTFIIIFPIENNIKVFAHEKSIHPLGYHTFFWGKWNKTRPNMIGQIRKLLLRQKDLALVLKTKWVQDRSRRRTHFCTLFGCWAYKFDLFSEIPHHHVISASIYFNYYVCALDFKLGLYPCPIICNSEL